MAASTACLEPSLRAHAACASFPTTHLWSQRPLRRPARPSVSPDRKDPPLRRRPARDRTGRPRHLSVRGDPGFLSVLLRRRVAADHRHLSHHPRTGEASGRVRVRRHLEYLGRTDGVALYLLPSDPPLRRVRLVPPHPPGVSPFLALNPQRWPRPPPRHSDDDRALRLTRRSCTHRPAGGAVGRSAVARAKSRPDSFRDLREHFAESRGRRRIATLLGILNGIHQQETSLRPSSHLHVEMGQRQHHAWIVRLEPAQILERLDGLGQPALVREVRAGANRRGRALPVTFRPSPSPSSSCPSASSRRFALPRPQPSTLATAPAAPLRRRSRVTPHPAVLHPSAGRWCGGSLRGGSGQVPPRLIQGSSRALR